MARNNSNTSTPSVMLPSESAFKSIGQHGISYALQGNVLLVRIPVDPAAIKAAPMSSTGKNKLVANTGGWLPVPGSDKGLRMNVGVIAPPNA